MSISGAIAVYFVCWWIVLFAILPFGIKSQSETGETIPGTDPGAPTAPGLAKKALWTTLIAVPVFGLVYLLWSQIDF
jgi:predicted secreted protein